MSEPALRLAGVARRFRTEAGELSVLNGADLSLVPGEIVALVAPSGTGKSTLLHLAGLLEKPDAGEVFFNGQAAGTLSDDARTAIRRQGIGFVYQFHHLLPEFTAAENIILPQLAAGTPRRAATERAQALLARFGLAGREQHRPGKLSGGEQQRVAIARALANQPRVLLADEPTGNLDTAAADGVFDMMQAMNREQGMTFLIVTHDPRLAKRCGRIIELVDGHVIGSAR